MPEHNETTAGQDEEEFLLRVIDTLTQAYRREAQPYIDRLVKLRAMRPPLPVIIPMDPKDMPEWLRRKIEDVSAP